MMFVLQFFSLCISVEQPKGSSNVHKDVNSEREKCILRPHNFIEKIFNKVINYSHLVSKTCYILDGKIKSSLIFQVAHDNIYPKHLLYNQSKKIKLNIYFKERIKSLNNSSIFRFLSKVSQKKLTNQSQIESYKISNLRSIDTSEVEIKLRTKFNKKISHDFDLAYAAQRLKPYVYPNDIISQEKYFGENACISIVDTGIDTNHLHLQHRRGRDPKVVAHYDFGDNEDDDNGHGSFVAGVAAGRTNCNPLMTQFNGVAPEAKLISVDIKNKTSGKFIFPNDLNELYIPSKKSGCYISLNAWTRKDPAFSSKIDSIAYENPEMTIIFPSTKNRKGKISPPGDCKNVISIGSFSGNSASLSFAHTGTPVFVQDAVRKVGMIGYTDPMGSPLTNFSKYHEGLFTNAIIGADDDTVQVFPDVDMILPEEAYAVLLFDTKELKRQYPYPIIRLPSHWLDAFSKITMVNIFSYIINDDTKDSGFNLQRSSGHTKESTFVKPDFIYPGGPVVGPKANSESGCSMNSMTIKEGPSVAAAFAAGDAAILTDFAIKTLKINPPLLRRSVKALMALCSKVIGKESGQIPDPKHGFGTPQLSEVVNMREGKTTKIYQDELIGSEERHDYCFTSKRAGKVLVTISWDDLPGRPTLTSPLFLIAATKTKPTAQIIANNAPNDEPAFDHFNNIQKLEIPCNNREEIRISIIAGKFSVDEPVKFTLALHGPCDFNTFVCTANHFKQEMCVRPCEGNKSVCGANHRCVCEDGRGGEFCQFLVMDANPRKPMTFQNIKRHEWTYISVYPRKWNKNCRMLADFSKIDWRKTMLALKIGSPPNWDDLDCFGKNCPWTGIEEEMFEYKYENWEYISKENPFVFGFYSLESQMNPTIINFSIIC